MVWCFSCFAVHAGWVLLWRRASPGEYDKAGSGQTIWIMFGYSWPITEVLYVFIMSCLSFVKGPHCCWAKMIARHGQDLKQKIPCTAVSEPVRSIVLTWHGWTWHVLTLNYMLTSRLGSISLGLTMSHFANCHFTGCTIAAGELGQSQPAPSHYKKNPSTKRRAPWWQVFCCWNNFGGDGLQNHKVEWFSKSVWTYI